MSNLTDAASRVRAYLDEVDQVNARNVRGLKYDDQIHGLNDKALLRSDLRTILGALAAPSENDIASLAWTVYAAAHETLWDQVDPDDAGLAEVRSILSAQVTAVRAQPTEREV